MDNVCSLWKSIISITKKTSVNKYNQTTYTFLSFQESDHPLLLLIWSCLYNFYIYNPAYPTNSFWVDMYIQ